jgi:hypothetical protein
MFAGGVDWSVLLPSTPLPHIGSSKAYICKGKKHNILRVYWEKYNVVWMERLQKYQP